VPARGGTRQIEMIHDDYDLTARGGRRQIETIALLRQNNFCQKPAAASSK